MKTQKTENFQNEKKIMSRILRDTNRKLVIRIWAVIFKENMTKYIIKIVGVNIAFDVMIRNTCNKKLIPCMFRW